MHQEYYKNYEQTVFSLFKWALIPDLNLSLFSSLVTLRSSIGETIIDLYVKIKKIRSIRLFSASVVVCRKRVWKSEVHNSSSKTDTHTSRVKFCVRRLIWCKVLDAERKSRCKTLIDNDFCRYMKLWISTDGRRNENWRTCSTAARNQSTSIRTSLLRWTMNRWADDGR